MANPLMVDRGKLDAKTAEIRAWLETARQYAHGKVDEWHAMVNTWIDAARKLLGDRPKIQAAIAAWGQANAKITATEAELRITLRNGEYWNGPGATGFETWVKESGQMPLERWKNTIGSPGAVSGAFVGALNKANDGVIDVLNGIYQALLEATKGIVGAFGDLGGIAKPGTTGVEIDPGAITAAVSKFITGLVMAAQKAVDTAATVLKTYDSAGNDVTQASTSLSNIIAPGKTLLDLESTPGAPRK